MLPPSCGRSIFRKEPLPIVLEAEWTSWTVWKARNTSPHRSPFPGLLCYPNCLENTVTQLKEVTNNSNNNNNYNHRLIVIQIYRIILTIVQKFGFLLTVLLGIILVINQINAQKSFIISSLYFSTGFHYVLITRWSKFYYTTSRIITPVNIRPVHSRLSSITPDVH